MLIGKIIGQVVATIKDPELEGLRLFVVQPLDEHRQSRGKALVAVDAIRCAGPGDIVYLAFKRDAAIALGDRPPVDAAVVGYVDQLAVEQEPGGPIKTWTP